MGFKIYRGSHVAYGLPKVKAGDPSPPSINLLNLVFTGFLTDPNSDADGQRTQAMQIQAMYPGSDFLVWSWSQDGYTTGDANQECAQLLAVMQAGNARGPYTHFIADGHSFGGCFLAFFMDYLAANAKDISVALARYIDPVPNVTETNPWTIPLGTTVKRAMQFTQACGMGWWFILGPNGSPLVPALETDTTLLTSLSFPLGTRGMNHIAIITDPRVWLPSLAMIQACLAPLVAA